MRLSKEKHPSGHIIIGGCGRLGAGLVARLSLEKRDVAVMDQRERALRKLTPSYGGQTMCTDVNDIDRLGDVGIRKADVSIVVTDRDSVNTMAIQIAKQLYDVRHVVARAYDAEKLKLLEGSRIEYFCPTGFSEEEINRSMDWED